MTKTEFIKKATEMQDEIVKDLTRSAWKRGVALYACDILDEIIDRSRLEGKAPATKAEAYEWALNGAKDWAGYSRSGCSLCYDGQIAERLCTASELKRTKRGQLNPNRSEDWIDVQARALYQAYRIIEKALFPNC